MNNISPKEWALGLFLLSSKASLDYRTFHDFIISSFSNIMPVTEIGASGPSWNGKYFKIKSKSYLRLLSNLSDIHLLSLRSGDNLLWGSTSKLDNEYNVVVSLNSGLCPFLGSVSQHLISGLLELQTWDFGFALEDTSACNPSLHVMGAGNGKLNIEERKRLNKWYSTKPEERIKRCRWVYPWNLLNEQQLNQPALNGTLREFILAGNGTLHSLKGDLSIWTVPENKLLDIREKLKGTYATVVDSP